MIDPPARNFAPMMSRTMKNLLSIKPENIVLYFNIILTYPNHEQSMTPELAADPVMIAIMQELDRQYYRYQQIARLKAEHKAGGAE